MNFDPELIKVLTETFKAELDEQLQTITDGLLFLEKASGESNEFSEKIDSIFRAGHNIKGAARSIGVENVAEIAHHIESMFSAIKKKQIKVTPAVIDLCLQAVDGMRAAMKAFVDKSELSFDLQKLLAQLASGSTENKEAIADQKKSEPDPAIKKAPSASSAQSESTIRVSLSHLDQVSALMEEIQVNKLAIDEYYDDLTKLNTKIQELSHAWKQAEFVTNNTIGNKFTDALAEVTHSTNMLQKNMHPRINELTTLSNSLQAEVRMLRLIPASELLRNFPRVARDLAQGLNKKVQLVIKGEDVKMDKMVLEGLKDPLTHLLRNAIDHGIENSDTRLAAGKPETGTILIEISEEGNQILITIKDDGGGMDVKKIAASAEAKNLVSKSELENMNEHDILNLIFLPGFSTKEKVTDVSGRGVGLDIVRENINALKGEVTVKTELKQGTTFSLRVPLTLASERGLMLACSGQIFALPVYAVERVFAINADEIIAVSGSQAVMVDKYPIPLRALTDILNLKAREDSNDRLAVIVMKLGWQSVALLVDEIIGEREIVIKSLQPPLGNVQFVSGGTLAGNGQAILVFNPADLINEALHIKLRQRSGPKKQAKETVEKPHILVVDDSITTRTMEKNVLEGRNYQVSLAVNGKEAWDILQKQKFSLLITDVSMPIMDGFSLTERVKKSSELHDLPVIIVTSMNSVEDKKRGVEVGADAYVVKSEFESETLLKIVEQLL